MPVTRLLEHERNKYISYDPEAHRYTYKPNNKIFRGITGWIDSFSKEPFIASEVAERVIKNPNGEYYGWAVEDVIAFWNNLKEYGDDIHLSIENVVNYGEYPEHETFQGHVDSFYKIMDDNHIEPIVSEFVVYNEDLERATPIDIVGVRDDKLIIVDIKTFRKGMEFLSYQNRTFKYPLGDLYESKYEKVSLQTSIPKRWLIDKYGFKESDFGVAYTLVINDDTTELIETMDYSDDYVPLMYDYND